MAVHHQPKAPMPSVKQVFDPVDLTEARRASGEATRLTPPSTPAGDSAEVVARARRRHFSSADKRRILEAADRCTRPGEIGALMRQEGVYSSSLSTWRRQRETADLTVLEPQKRGPKPPANRAETLRIEQLTRERDRLQSRLDKALLVIDVQKKLAALLGNPIEDFDGKA